MNVYAYAYWYVGGPLLRPVVSRLHWAGHTAKLYDAWKTGKGDGTDWYIWLNNDEPEQALLLASDILTGAHQPGVQRARECQERGIPVVSVQHGVPPHPLRAAADVVCVWGEAYADMFPRNRTVVTGNPALGNVPNRDYALGQLSTYGVKAPYALFTGSLRNDYSDSSLFARAIGDVAKRMPVLISPHPNPAETHHLRFFEELTAAHDNVRIWREGADWLRLLVSGADLVFGRSSVLVEAAAQGIPALVARNEPDPHVDGAIYFEYDGPDSVARALRGSRSAAFTQRYANGLHYAADNVVDVLRQAVGEADYAAV